MTRSTSPGLRPSTIVVLVALVLTSIVTVTYVSQALLEHKLVSELGDASNEQRRRLLEDTMQEAEISKIRSDTLGSLFWLKLIALFVTVGGAVGGYLVGQNRATQARIGFEIRKNVDVVYQAIVRELADESPVLRAAAAVKLGAILREFPDEWRVSDKRERQLLHLTKQVLAAALSIEKNEKVLKTITINLVLQKSRSEELANARELDLSGASATDAYWARIDFSYADFYQATLDRVSFRKSDLTSAQFREASLNSAVLAEATCSRTNFKLADLRGADFTDADLREADFTDADLTGASFERAKLFGVVLPAGAELKDVECEVDVSEQGDRSKLVTVREWQAGCYEPVEG